MHHEVIDRAEPAARRRVDGNVARVIAERFTSHTDGVAGFFLGIWGKAAYDLGADVFGLARSWS